MQVDRDKMRLWADGLAAAVAALLPWSTSATLIAIVVWLIVLIPTLRGEDLREVLRHPAGWLPVALFVVAALGMLWADVSWKERFAGLYPFARLLLLPLLFAQFKASGRWHFVPGAFLFSCTVLLAISYSGLLIGGEYLRSFKDHGDFGVPVRDYIAQAGEFTLCAVGLLGLAIHYWTERRTLYLLAALALAILFLFNAVYFTPSRTTLATLPILLMLLVATQFRLTQAVALLAVVAFICGVIFVSSTRVQQRITTIYTEAQVHRTDENSAGTRAGLRVEFWRQALTIIRAAPVLGHGTGTVRDRYRQLAKAEGHSYQPTVNPHNQIFMVAIQLGGIGALILIAMWIAHFALFLRGATLAAWIGLAVVAQNVIGSLFNTHLFDFVQGWTYILGVGAVGGAMFVIPRGAASALSSGNRRAGS